MKQSDIFTLILVAGIGTLGAFFVCQMLLGDPSKAEVKFTTISNIITSDLVDPDPEVFNSMAINPTVEVYVGDCEDIDQNGILDEIELAACAAAKGEEEEDEEGENGEDGGDSEEN